MFTESRGLQSSLHDNHINNLNAYHMHGMGIDMGRRTVVSDDRPDGGGVTDITAGYSY